MPVANALDPLAGDWSEGLRGPARALGIPAPQLLALDGLPLPAPVQSYLPAPLPVAPLAEEVEAPDAWGAATEDPLQSAPPPASEPPSVIITFTDPPATAPRETFPDTTPPSPSPAFQADVTPATPAPAFLPEVTPPSAAPSFQADVTPPSPAPSFQADVTPATPWGDQVAAPPQPAPDPWKDAPVAAPGPGSEATGSWDQVTALNVRAPVLGSPADSAWEMPPPSVPPAGAAPEPAADEAWSSPPPEGGPAPEWSTEAPAGDWEAVRKPEATPVLAETHAAAWSTLSSGPDWSAPPSAEAPPADESWGSAPPAAAEPIWNPAAAPEDEASSWDAQAAPAAEWSAPEAPAGPAASWNAAPAGASTLEQLDSDPPEPTPGAAAELFGSVPVGASLAGDDDEQPPEDLGPPEELSSPEDFLKPVDMEDDPDLLVPVDEEALLPAPQPPAQPLAMMQPVGVGVLVIAGEHRVAVHTRGGRTRRGSIKDIDLSKSQFPLAPQGGGAAEPVYHAEVKAIFFMLAPGEKPETADGGKVRVTFADGRTIEGNRHGAEAKHGFFLIPTDASRTNTRRIYIAREATTDIKDG